VPALNPLIHQPIRLRIMAALASLEPDAQLQFTFLRDHLDITDGNLGAHLLKLEEAGYLSQQKQFIRRRPCTTVRLNARGRRAFEDHVAYLKRILEGTTSLPPRT
jgi:DNA-binding MarR family transcriptional regulator